MIARRALAQRVAAAPDHEMIALIDEFAREHDARTYVRRAGDAVEARFKLAGAEGRSEIALTDAARDWARQVLGEMVEQLEEMAG